MSGAHTSQGSEVVELLARDKMQLVKQLQMLQRKRLVFVFLVKFTQNLEESLGRLEKKLHGLL